MKTLSLIALLALISVTGCTKHEAQDEHGTSSPPSGDVHNMHDQHESHVAPTLPAGQRWPTDAPLRDSMSNIRNAVAKAQSAFVSRQLSADEAASLASTIDDNIKYMFANCKLAPEPDAALHALIVRMMSASNALKKEPLSTEGLPQLEAVLHDYENTFDHPGWAMAK